MDETITSIAKWADETFGPCDRETALERAFDEMQELKQEWAYCYEGDKDYYTKLAEESADVCITLSRFIYLVDPEAINKKMAINRARKWKINKDGTGQHL